MMGLYIAFPPTREEHIDKSQHVRHLQDLCLRCVGDNLDNIPCVSRYLAPAHKEILLEYLVNHDKLSSDYLRNVTYNLLSGSLKSLKFYKSEQVSDTFMKIIMKTHCQLEWICIHGCVNVTDDGIRTITQSQESLRGLELRKLSKLTDKGLTKILSPELEVLDLHGTSGITSAGLNVLLRKNRNIKRLNIAFCGGLDEKVIMHIANSLGNNLECLDVTGLNFVNTEGVLALSENCPNLKMLVLHGASRITACGAQALFSHCQQLLSLDLSYCTNIIKPLQNLPTKLQELSLCGVPITDEELFVSCISQLSNLQLARFCGVSALNDQTLTKILKNIGKNLINLDLSGSVMSSLSDDGLAAITKYCTQLESLALSLIKNITGYTLIPMLENSQRSENLSCLLLSCKQISEDVIESIANNCRNLQALNVAGLSFISDDLLNKVAHNCPKLYHINLKGCRNVTDNGVVALARLCPLRVCILSGLQQITDQSIFVLANCCPYLEELHLNGCALVSQPSVKYLEDQCIPRVWTTHKTPNASGDQVARNLDTGQFGIPPNSN